MEIISEPGWIEVVTGPMFAGKSEELIRRVHRLQYAKKNVLVFKPSIDDRYSLDCVESHLHNKVKAYPAKNSADIRAHIDTLPDAVVIDEVQFFDEGVIDIIDELANKGVRVIVGGLDMDFRGIPFPIVATLMAKAEAITKLTAICVKCGCPATRTQRIINGIPARFDDPVILVGANESYEPRCRHCHEIGKGLCVE